MTLRLATEKADIVKLRRLGKLEQALGDHLNALPAFVHAVIEEVCGYEGAKGESFYTQHLPEIEWKILQVLVASIKLLVTQTIRLDLKKQEIMTDLLEVGVSESTAHILVDSILARYSEIRKSLREEATKISKAYLKDFDWKVQATLSSDKLSSMRQQVLFLTLYVHNEDGTKKEIFLELSKSDLEILLKNLTDANEIVQKLKC